MQIGQLSGLSCLFQPPLEGAEAEALKPEAETEALSGVRASMKSWCQSWRNDPAELTFWTRYFEGRRAWWQMLYWEPGAS